MDFLLDNLYYDAEFCYSNVLLSQTREFILDIDGAYEHNINFLCSSYDIDEESLLSFLAKLDSVKKPDECLYLIKDFCLAHDVPVTYIIDVSIYANFLLQLHKGMQYVEMVRYSDTATILSRLYS